MPVRRRILQSTLLAVAVTGVALGLPLGYTALTVVHDVTHRDLANRARQIAAVLDSQLAERRQIDMAAVDVLRPEGGQVRVTGLSSGDRTLGTSPGPDEMSESVPMAQHGQVTVAASAAPLRTDQLEVAGVVTLLVVLSVGIGATVATVTARRLAEPLRHVADRAARLGAGDFRPDPRRYRINELDKLAEALDTSASALAQLLQRERELIGDVSHQLRSRLTAMQLRLESLAMHAEEATAEDANAALEQSERLSTVLDELLAAAHAARAVDAEPVDLASQLPIMVQEWRASLRQHGRALRLRAPNGLLARATPSRLRETLGVLLDNALRHGGGTVHVSARRGDAMIVVEVTDGGGGVPEDLAAHIFERGVSGGGSTGVGLALARALVEADGGRLELSVPRTATFSIFLPVPRADDVPDLRWPTEASPR
ncbi:ATP-binding protein [Crossiella cryophila]